MATIYTGYCLIEANANLDNLATASTTNTTAITTETNRATAAEAGLQTQITTINTEMGQLVTIPTPATSGGQGSKNITTAGTPLQLVAVSTPCRAVDLTARPANTGKIAWGFSNTVRATAGAEVGAILSAGESRSIPVADVQDIWIDASVNGEGASFTYLV